MITMRAATVEGSLADQSMRRHSMECLPQWSSNSLLLFVAVVVAAADVVVVAVAVVVAVVVAVRGKRSPKCIYTNS